MYTTVDELEKRYKRSVKSLPQWVIVEMADKVRIEDEFRKLHRSAQPTNPADCATAPVQSDNPSAQPLI